MIYRYIMLIIFTLLSFEVVARETKEQKRAHTHNLRTWLQLVDFTYDDHNLPQALKLKRIEEMDQFFELIAVKLTKKKEAKLRTLYKAYRSGDSFERVRQIELRSTAIKFFRVITLPAQKPDFALGEKLYKEYCASCHGVKGAGDGIFTRNPELPMVPAPKDLRAQYDLGTRSPYSYFNTLMIGSDGTAMKSYDKSMKSHDLWSLAFYMSSAWRDDQPEDPKERFTLEDISTMTNLELRERIGKEKTEGKLWHLRRISSFLGTTPRK